MARPLPQLPAEDDPTPEPKLEVVAEPAELDEPVEVEEKDPYDARRCDHAGSAEALRPPDRRRPAAHAAGGARAGPPQGRGRRGREAPPDRVQPPARDVDHAELHEGRRPAARPDPGRQPRPDPRGREVRLQARLQALDVRDLVDPPGRDPRARRPGADDPPPGARRRADAQGAARTAHPRPEAEPRPGDPGDREGEPVSRPSASRSCWS